MAARDGALQLPERASAGEVADALDQLAARSGEEAFARAARVLRRGPGGRPARNDAAAVQEVEHLLKTGAARTLNKALRRVAAATEPYGRRKSVVERLRRKVSAARE